VPQTTKANASVRKYADRTRAGSYFPVKWMGEGMQWWKGMGRTDTGRLCQVCDAQIESR
jgi:hypothetical protein